MSHNLFENGKEVSVQAYFTGQRFDLKTFDKDLVLARAPTMIKAGKSGYAALFRFGTVVFFGTTESEEDSFFQTHSDFFTSPFVKLEEESAQMMADSKATDKITNALITLQNCYIEHLQIIATVLSKSVYMAHYEEQVTNIFNLIEPMASDTKKGKRNGHNTRNLLSHIGEVLLIESRMIGLVEIEDKPDLIWERPDLGRLYMQMSGEYELKDRMANLRQKLNLIHVTADTLLNFQQNRSSHHVEWYIVILIMVEIVMTLAEKYLGF